MRPLEEPSIRPPFAISQNFQLHLPPSGPPPHPASHARLPAARVEGVQPPRGGAQPQALQAVRRRALRAGAGRPRGPPLARRWGVLPVLHPAPPPGRRARSGPGEKNGVIPEGGGRSRPEGGRAPYSPRNSLQQTRPPPPQPRPRGFFFPCYLPGPPPPKLEDFTRRVFPPNSFGAAKERAGGRPVRPGGRTANITPISGASPAPTFGARARGPKRSRWPARTVGQQFAVCCLPSQHEFVLDDATASQSPHQPRGHARHWGPEGWPGGSRTCP